jgi:hypothetical protein
VPIVTADVAVPPFTRSCVGMRLAPVGVRSEVTTGTTAPVPSTPAATAFGTPLGVQLAAVFQSVLVVPFQMLLLATCAWRDGAAAASAREDARSDFVRRDECGMFILGERGN